MEETISADTFAHQLGDKVLACRELGHVWRPHAVEIVRSGERSKRIGGYLRIMRCSQCRTERQQLLDSRGSVIRNGYHYPDGYLAAHVERGFTRDTFRLESITRWLDRHPTEQAAS